MTGKVASLRAPMKRSSILALSALALLANACEKHPASQLPPEHSTAFGEHAWSAQGGAKHGGEVSEGHAAAAKVEAASEAKGGETPKFFPAKK